MSDLMEDNMDDQFREAAKNYPLKTKGAADWNKVHAALQDDEAMPVFYISEKREVKSGSINLWWLLLLPLGWIGHESWQRINATHDKISTPVQTLQADPVKTNNSYAASRFGKGKEKLTISEEHLSRMIGVRQREPRTSKSDNNAAFSAIRKQQGKYILLNRPPGNQSAEHSFNGNVSSDNINSANTGTPVKPELKNENSSQPIITDETKPMAFVQSKISNDSSASAILKADGKLQTENNNGQTASRKPTRISHSYRFYSGVLLGADASSIHFQSVKGMGYSAGVLLGYHFSKSRFSIETGIYWDRKDYYTVGKYFNKSQEPYLNNVDLLYVDGYCNMFEIPLNLRYNFSNHKSTNFFAVAGLSSYIMNKESYGFGYQYNGWAGYNDYSFYHSTRNWFSVLNISAGYEHRLGKLADLRIEPYAKLPLTGLGKGNLSIISGGLNVGLIRHF